MKITLVAIVAVLLLMSSKRVQAQSIEETQSLTTETMTNFADSFFQQALAEARADGAVVGVVYRGETVLLKGYGMANRATNTPVVVETTRFRLASVTKSFTALAALQLVETGQLDLRTDANRWLSGFQIPPYAGQPVTLHQLLTHTAGFDQTQVGSGSVAPEPAPELGAYLAEHMPTRVFAPGAVINYSNYGFDLVGQLVAEAAEMPYEQYVAEAILRPLEMSNSSYTPTETLARGYFGGTAVEYMNSTNPSGGLNATAPDMTRFMVAMLEGGKLAGSTRISPDPIEQMQERQFSHHPALRGTGYGLFEDLQGGRRALWHDGALPGYRSLLYLWPAERIGVFVASTSEADLGGDFVDRFRTTFLAPLGVAAPRSAATSDNHDRFEGTYTRVRYERDSSLRYVSLFNQIRVQATQAGITIAGTPYVGIGSALFMAKEKDQMVAFNAGEGPAVFYFDGLRAYERVPWHRTLPFALGVPATCLGIFLIGSLHTYWRWWQQRKQKAVSPGYIPRYLPIIGEIQANLAFCLPVLALVTLSYDVLRSYGLAFPTTTLVLNAMWLLPPTTLLLAGLTAAGARNGLIGRGERLKYLAMSVTGVVFCSWLQHWNLLGAQW
ncbi:beta-lactamase family protein [Candidatus Gracilibacteria bacterium]|nr:beta-lactamase family protein [Candidatus Gracilibacteria bacterium]